MARVMRPEGVLVAYDNDWETLTVDSADRALTRTVLNAWCDRFPSGWTVGGWSRSSARRPARRRRVSEDQRNEIGLVDAPGSLQKPAG
jgi:hypothetical protein